MTQTFEEGDCADISRGGTRIYLPFANFPKNQVKSKHSPLGRACWDVHRSVMLVHTPKKKTKTSGERQSHQLPKTNSCD